MKSVVAKHSPIAGGGLFAGEAIRAGEVILQMTGRRVTDAYIDEHYDPESREWDDPFEVGGGEYLLLDETPRLINHSCEPNAGIRGEGELFALRDIAAGEELFYDYSTTVGKNAPDESDWEMQCLCGAPACRGVVGNWQTLPPERLLFYKTQNALPGFILKQL